jgi:hypothetical protein
VDGENIASADIPDKATLKERVKIQNISKILAYIWDGLFLLIVIWLIMTLKLKK